MSPLGIPEVKIEEGVAAPLPFTPIPEVLIRNERTPLYCIDGQFIGYEAGIAVLPVINLESNRFGQTLCLKPLKAAAPPGIASLFVTGFCISSSGHRDHPVSAFSQIAVQRNRGRGREANRKNWLNVDGRGQGTPFLFQNTFVLRKGDINEILRIRD